jgi:hypothetical protein
MTQEVHSLNEETDKKTAPGHSDPQSKIPDPQSPPSLLTLSPAWFFAASAAVYGTGFLVITLFHDAYNLRGLDDSIFKLRYAHVGIICLIIPATIGLASFVIFDHFARRRRFKAAKKKADADDKAKAIADANAVRGGEAVADPTVSEAAANAAAIRDAEIEYLRCCWKKSMPPRVLLSITLFALIFYSVFIFAPPSTFRENRTQVILWIATFWAYSFRRLSNWFEDSRPILSISLRYAQGIGLGVLLGFAIWKYKADLWEMIWPVGLWYFVMPMLMGFVPFAIFRRLNNRNVSVEEGRRSWQLVALGILGFMWFFCVLVFGNGIINYIPAGKGGSDFTTATLVKLTLNDEQPLPASLSDRNPGLDLVLIDGGVASIFVANPAENGGPPKWRQSRKSRPTVVEIPRASIKNLYYGNEDFLVWATKHPPPPAPQ